MRCLSASATALLAVVPTPAWANPDTTPAAMATGFVVATIFALAGVVLGLGLAARKSRGGPEATVPAGPPVTDWPDPLPQPCGRQVWQGGDGAGRSRAAAGLARLLAGRSGVLLLPAPAARAACLAGMGTAPGVRWLEPGRPDLDAVLAGVNTLAARGPSAVVVDGADALAAVDDLVALLEGAAVPVILLLEDGVAAPPGLVATRLSTEALGLLTA